jgi:hypothetical protein
LSLSINSLRSSFKFHIQSSVSFDVKFNSLWHS